MEKIFQILQKSVLNYANVDVCPINIWLVKLWEFISISEPSTYATFSEKYKYISCLSAWTKPVQKRPAIFFVSTLNADNQNALFDLKVEHIVLAQLSNNLVTLICL